MMTSTTTILVISLTKGFPPAHSVFLLKHVVTSGSKTIGKIALTLTCFLAHDRPEGTYLAAESNAA
jgi:hypothetical protein